MLAFFIHLLCFSWSFSYTLSTGNHFEPAPFLCRDKHALISLSFFSSLSSLKRFGVLGPGLPYILHCLPQISILKITDILSPRQQCDKTEKGVKLHSETSTVESSER